MCDLLPSRTVAQYKHGANLVRVLAERGISAENQRRSTAVNLTAIETELEQQIQSSRNRCDDMQEVMAAIDDLGLPPVGDMLQAAEVDIVQCKCVPIYLTTLNGVCAHVCARPYINIHCVCCRTM